MHLEPIDTLDARLHAALSAEGLPVSDLGSHNQYLWQLIDDGVAVGFCGIERYGDQALLRSLVVLPDQKGQGHGSALVRYIIGASQAAGIRQLWLLTNTATVFFEHLGWTVRDRGEAPEAILASREFASLCPASATCMSFQT
jgi:amino-acid N-acetyltransferase